MAAFLTAFGVGGVVARYYQLSHPAASGIGVVAGIAMASIVYQFAKLLYSQQASTDLTMNRLVGHLGGGLGGHSGERRRTSVRPAPAGEVSEHLARSAGGGPVARGTTVVITGLGGDSVTVTPGESHAAGGL